MLKLYKFNLNEYNAEYYRIYEKTSGIDFDTIPSFALIKKYLQLQKGDSFLDAGCGDGHLLNYLSRDNNPAAFGIDFSEAALELTNKPSPNISYSAQNLTNIAFKDESFDKILCFNVIEHIEKQDDVMKEFQRVLKKGGTLVMGTNIKDSFQWWLYQRFIGEHTHVKEFNVTEFLEFISSYFSIAEYKKSSGVFRFSPPVSWIFHYIFHGDIIVRCRK